MNALYRYFAHDDASEIEGMRDRIFPNDQLKRHGALRILISVACIFLTLFTLYMAFTITLGNVQTRALHLGFVIPMIFMLYPITSRFVERRLPSTMDWILAVLAIAAFGWAFINAERFGERSPYVDVLEPADIVFGIAAVLVVLEAARRTVGLTVVGLTFIFLIYAATGPYWPGMFEHRGVDLPSLVEFLFTLDEGMFNFLMGIMATYLFTFLTFATFLRASGADKFFTSFALALAGHRRGGPAKVAIVSSGLMGMLSGSSISNVVTTGSLTIPMMKRTGYRNYEAAAIETVSSVGGGLTPPLMGAAVFVMSEFTDIPLITIIGYSILPAILYYLSLYFYVDIKARKRGLKGLDRSELPSLKDVVLKGGHVFIPVLALVYLLIIDFTPFYASAVCVLLTFAITFLRKETRLTPRRFLVALEGGTRVALSVTPLLASAAIIYGVINITGLLVKITSIVLALANGSLLLALVLILLMSYVIGMGLPTTAAYVIIAVLGAPALGELGLPMLAAHLVIFWFSQDSTITPPIAMTAFVGARIAGANPHRTGFECVLIAKALYIIPFVFAYGSLLDQSLVEVFFDFFMLIGVFAMMPPAVEGFWFRKLNLLERALCVASAVLFFMAVLGPLAQGLPWMGIALAVLGIVVFAVRRRADPVTEGAAP